MSRRAQKKVSTFTSGSWSLTTSTTYHYDGWNLIREVSSLTSGLGTSTSVSYVWGLDLSGSLQGAGGIGGLLARTTTNNPQSTTFYTYDGNGNVSELVNTDGSIAAHYEYDPYGNAIAPVVSDNPFRFSTKYLDAETGLLYYGYRYYSPSLGRWLNRDLVEETFGLNLYTFVQNNPQLFVDPLGLYNIDVHKWLTEYLAFTAGFCQEDAKKIGQINQSIDDAPETDPFLQYPKNRFKGDKKLRQAMQPHFPIDPAKNIEAKVEKDSVYVNQLINTSIKLGDIEQFSKALHTYQDSWSHEWHRNAHPNSSDDVTWINNRWNESGRDLEMASFSYEKILSFLKNNPDICICSKPQPFPKDFVKYYLAIDNDKRKMKYLGSAGLEGYPKPNSFWYEYSTSLPSNF